MFSKNIAASNSELIEKLRSMVKNERELLTEILRHLREVEVRQLFLERGYSSMFAFCTEALGYSEAEAHVRIQAMRLMSSVPMVEQKIASGELSLSVAARAQSCLRKAKSSLAERQVVVASLIGKSTRQAERELIERFPELKKPEVERAVSGGMTRLEFAISEVCLEKLKRLKNHMAHSNFEGRMEVMFEQLVDLALKKYEQPATKSLRTHQVRPRPNPEKRTRYIPSQIRRQVWQKAGGQCQYRDPASEHRCSTRYGLEVDHIHEYASGGSNSIENLRLLCGPHNRWREIANNQSYSLAKAIVHIQHPLGLLETKSGETYKPK